MLRQVASGIAQDIDDQPGIIVNCIECIEPAPQANGSGRLQRRPVIIQGPGLVRLRSGLNCERNASRSLPRSPINGIHPQRPMNVDQRESVACLIGCWARPGCLTEVLKSVRVTSMVRLLWMGLLLLVLTAHARAEDVSRLQDPHMAADLVQQFALESGMAAVKGLLSRVDTYLQEHFDLDGQYRADSSNDGGSGRFRFKWYPDGKGRSADGFEADARFEALPHQFSFRFRFSEPQLQNDSSEADVL